MPLVITIHRQTAKILNICICILIKIEGIYNTTESSLLQFVATQVLMLAIDRHDFFYYRPVPRRHSNEML